MTRVRRMLPALARHAALLIAAGALLVAGEAVAQGAAKDNARGSSVTGVPNAMQGFSQNRDQPIQIEAQSLEVRDKDKIATFAGDVKVIQGDTTLRSKSLLVFYEQDKSGAAAGSKAGKESKGSRGGQMQAASPGPGGSSSIRRLEAKGSVVVTQKDQTVTGEAAIFDTRTNIITMSGGVILTQGQNVLRGDRLIVDMATGVSRVEGGRVQGLFLSSGGGIGAPAPAPGAPLPLGNR
jgi:lipopolysaccharide export system protein LptA